MSTKAGCGVPCLYIDVEGERVAVGGKEIVYSISVGVTLMQPAMNGTNELIAATDAALPKLKVI